MNPGPNALSKSSNLYKPRIDLLARDREREREREREGERERQGEGAGTLHCLSAFWVRMSLDFRCFRSVLFRSGPVVLGVGLCRHADC